MEDPQALMEEVLLEDCIQVMDSQAMQEVMREVLIMEDITITIIIDIALEAGVAVVD